jgi:hypothetical protein
LQSPAARVVKAHQGAARDIDAAVIGLECPHGHRFDFDKNVLPAVRLSGDARGMDFGQKLGGAGKRPGFNQEFHPASCTRCDWRGPDPL